MRKKLFLSTLAIPLLAISGASGSTVLFDFNGGGVVGADPSGSDFDPSGVGDTVSLTSTSGTVLVTTIVDITAPEFSGTTLTGNILSSVTGGVTTNIGGSNAFGINNPSINNADFDLLGEGAEANDFNPGESVTFSFDQDVIFTSLELESVQAASEFDVLIDGVAVLETIGDDSFLELGGLDGLVITAGSEITFAVDGPLFPTGSPDAAESTSVRVETFTVQIVPEPSSLALLGLGGLVMFKRRRN